MDSEGSLKNFDIIKLLGQGAFGQVFLVQRKLDHKKYALKKVKMGGMKEKEKDNALNQIRILASLNDQYIVKFKQAFYDTPSGYLCIVMQYASGGDLLKLINQHIKSKQRIPEDEIWKALGHMAKALKSLHDKKILHRDLKSANIFITGDGDYKLGDLNVSKVLKRDLAYTQTGTPYYASPQVWADQPYDRKSDMWSLGCVIYQMASLQPPFKAQDLQSLYKKVKLGKYNALPNFYSQELSFVINNLLKVKAKERWGTQQLLSYPRIAKNLGIDFESQGVYDTPLLKTIKFNPYNLNALKGKLPKASYDDTKQTTRQTLSRHSRDSIDYQRQRILSACGARKQYGLSPMPQKKEQQKKASNVNVPLLQKYGLPPRPNVASRNSEQRQKQVSSRLRRVGQEILGNQRSMSVNK